jgi:hypothetical protein
MVFGLLGDFRTVAPATLVFTDQHSVDRGGCAGSFVVNLDFGRYFTFTVATGTFTATTTGTVATASLSGALVAPIPAVTFTATLTLDTGTQTGTIVEVFPTEDGPVTITVNFAKVGGVYVIGGVTVSP